MLWKNTTNNTNYLNYSNCISNCPIDFYISKNNICKKENIEVSEIQEGIMNGKCNISEGNDIIIKDEGKTFTITTTYNQKNNKNNKVTKIN